MLNKRAHTLTKILESKIVNNPDVFQDLKQVLGSFKFEEDTDESSQPEPSTMTVISPAGETRIQIAPTESKPGNSTSEDGVYTYRRHYINEPSSAASLTQGSGAKAKPTSVPKAKPSDSLIQSRSKRTKKQKSQHHQSNHSEDFPEIEFSSHKSYAMIGHRGGTLRGEGAQLRIPPNAIKKRISAKISLQGCISGPFILPEDTQLASPVFLVQYTPQYGFQRKVTLTLQHLCICKLMNSVMTWSY